MPVLFEHGLIPIMQRDNFLRIEKTRRGNGSFFNRVDMTEEGLPFWCNSDGLEGQVTNRDVAFYKNMFDARVAKANLVKSNMARSRENRVASTIFNPTVWTGASLYADVSGGGPWATAATNVVAQMSAWRLQVHTNCGFFPNALIAPTPQIENLLMNSGILGRFAITARETGGVTRQMLRDALGAILGFKYLVEAGALQNTANEGQPYAGGYIWNPSYVMVAKLIPRDAPPEMPGLGRTPVWDTGDGYADDSLNLKVYEYPEPQSKSQIVQVEEYTDELVYGPEFGFLAKVA
jgi:hypothetical protein